jgi:5-methylcytosine-specific restriction endonuclease McrA
MSKGRERRMLLKRGLREALKQGSTVTCILCGNPIRYYSDLTIDHLLPKSKGGRNDFNNLAPAHFICNQAKRDSLLPDLIYTKEETK